MDTHPTLHGHCPALHGYPTEQTTQDERGEKKSNTTKQSDKDQCHTFLMAAFLLLVACVVNCEYLLCLHTATGDWLDFS